MEEARMQALAAASTKDPALRQALGLDPKPEPSGTPEGVVKEEGWGDWALRKYGELRDRFRRWGQDAGEAASKNLIRPKERETAAHERAQRSALDYDPHVNIAEQADEVVTDIGREGGGRAGEAAFDYGVGKGIGAGAAGSVRVIGKGKQAVKNLAKSADDAIEAEAKAAQEAARAPSSAAGRQGPGTFVAKRESMSAEARAYEEAVAGSPPPGHTYRVPYTNPNPRGRPHVDFDGVQRGVPVDAKVAVVTRQKTVSQAARQAEALRQSGTIGVWKVPSLAEARRARAVIEKANAGDRLLVVVEKPQ